MLADANARGVPTKPLLQAAQAGAGGGKGPTITSKAGLRPSYKVRILCFKEIRKTTKIDSIGY